MKVQTPNRVGDASLVTVAGARIFTEIKMILLNCQFHFVDDFW